MGKRLAGTEEKIIPLNGEEPGFDVEGEICYRGRNTFMGYFKNPDETNRTIDA